MGTTARRTTLWLVLAVLAIGGAAWMTMGASADVGVVAVACDNGATDADQDKVGGADNPQCVEGNLQPGAPSCEGLVALYLAEDSSASNSDAFVTVTSDGTYLTVVPQPGVNVWRTVVKGGNNSNVYLDNDLVGLHSPLNNGGNVPAISHWTVCYTVDEVPNYQFQIAKTQNGGPEAGTTFDFEVQCDTGTPFDVTVGAGADLTALSDVIETDSDSCTVTEVDATGGLGSWSTDELTISKDLSSDQVIVFEFVNTWIEPEPESANIWVNKKFEGPESWDFGFAFICQDFGNQDTFVLSGGESEHITVPFLLNGVTDDDDYYGNLCAVVEQALPGDWTVNVSVSGASDYEVISEAGQLSGALFEVHPGDSISITFENIAGYDAQRPSGIPPQLVT
ncbi:MAG: hypothetical protein ACR2NL_09010 [Acidimicrobiia bacterium]